MLNVTGDARDEIIVCDQQRVWIYAQDRPFTGKRIYDPIRNPDYNESNYRTNAGRPSSGNMATGRIQPSNRPPSFGRLKFHFNRLVAPFRIAGDEDWRRELAGAGREMLLEVRLAIFIADHPRIQVSNRVGPGAERDPAIRKPVILLDRFIQRCDRVREPTRRISREIVLKQHAGAQRETRACEHAAIANATAHELERIKIGPRPLEVSILIERKIGRVIEERYREIVAAVDSEFARNRDLHSEKIHCRPGCTDCCYHIFPITEIEAAQISEGLQRLEPQNRGAIESRAREYVEARLLRGARLPCPALDHGVCSIYEFRPLMCHKFGMPLYNPDKPDRIFACELNFKDGEEIQDPQLIQIQTGIHQTWKELQADYKQLHRTSENTPLTVAHAILYAGMRSSDTA
jgi:Fe-S-cluster containining protein